MKTTKDQQLQYIQELKNSVSWADEINTLELNGNAFAYTESLYYTPIHWRHYLALESDYFNNPAVMLGTVDIGEDILPTCFLIGGNPPKEVASRITSNWLANKPEAKFCLRFLDDTACLEYAEVLERSLDGVDWGRTLSGYAENGRERQLVMEWD